MATIQEQVERAAQSETNLNAQRMVAVRLAATWPRPLVLTWNMGKPGAAPGQKTKRTLRPGDKTLMPIANAKAYFGAFDIPHDLADMVNETEIADKVKFFNEEMARSGLTWGDFPKRRNHEREGNDALGPHRFPDVHVTVIEADGAEWPEINLRELYNYGEYRDAELKPLHLQQATENAELVRLRAENAENKHEIAQIMGMLKMLAAQGKIDEATIEPVKTKVKA